MWQHGKWSVNIWKHLSHTVSVTAGLRYIYRSAHTFHASTSLQWQSYSEIKVCKVDQWLQRKVVFLHVRNIWEFHAKLLEALYNCALLYWTVARLIHTFRGVQLPVFITVYVSVHSRMSEAIIEQCVDKHRHWKVKDYEPHVQWFMALQCLRLCGRT
jgi:hypothetical protein